MQLAWTQTQTWLVSHGHLVFPLLIAVWISWSDLKTRKIPNYLTLSAALAGLAYNLVIYGWGGLADGALGLLIGFGFLILPYLMGGMGAGDVKALAALGAWLGPAGTLHLFCYMAVAGGLMSLAVLVWRRLLWQRIWNMVLCQEKLSALTQVPVQKTPGIPYGVAMLLGMGLLIVSAGG